MSRKVSRANHVKSALFYYALVYVVCVDTNMWCCWIGLDWPDLFVSCVIRLVMNVVR
jgi:hypothetical protein